MAKSGTCYFDNKGGFFKTPEEATISDLADVLGKVGGGEGLSLGLASDMLKKRSEIEAIFAQHDAMVSDKPGLIRSVK